ncbi:MAG: thioesterase family protein [Micrococcales bacterium]|nr:thioesterase family protein [Micrococcales bacterium]
MTDAAGPQPTLQEMLDSAHGGGSVVVAEGWGQGRATYGGLVGALLLAAIRGQVEREAREGMPRQPLRSLTVSFVGPVAPGQAEVEAVVLRAGKNVTQGQALLRQDGEVAGAALASFGAHRDSALAMAPEHPMPQLPGPGTVPRLPFIPGRTPDFFAHVDLRQVAGALPFSSAQTSGISGWMRLDAPPAHFGEEHLVALADAWPPAVIQMLDRPAPASSLTWTLEVIDELEGIAPDAFWAYDVTTDTARDGYAHTHAVLWRADGTPAAISRQTIAVFG